MAFIHKALTISLLGFLFIFQGELLAQQNQRPIEKTHKKGVYKYNNTRLSPKQLMELTESNPVAYRQMKKAKSHYDLATIFGTIGGGVVGWAIGSSISGKDFNFGLLTVGGIFIACSIPFIIDYKNRSKIAVEHYNSRLNMSEYKTIDYKLAFTGNGLGLVVSF